MTAKRNTMTRERSGKGASSSRAPAKLKGVRLAPGELDKLVLAYMRKHKKELPLGAGAAFDWSSLRRWRIASS